MKLKQLLPLLREEDILIITADHGCDPTWQGSDHTRENIPVLFFGKQVKPQILKPMETFSDIGQTLAEVLGLKCLDVTGFDGGQLCGVQGSELGRGEGADLY